MPVKMKSPDPTIRPMSRRFIKFVLIVDWTKSNTGLRYAVISTK